MDISNKTLAMFLVAAIVVSLAGTMISLNKLDQMSLTGITGYATDVPGEVRLTLDRTLSIAIDGNDFIDFLDCVADQNSNITIRSTTIRGDGETPGACINYLVNATSGIVIMNDGNVRANVTVNVSQVGTFDNATTSSFLPSALGNWSRIGYQTINNSDNPGCLGSLAAWDWFELADTGYNVCDDLGYSGSGNRVRFHAQVQIPPQATATLADNRKVDITFFAEDVV